MNDRPQQVTTRWEPTQEADASSTQAPARNAVTPDGRAESPREPATLPAISGYEVLEQIGRGGMGVVYRARQIGLNRIVAIKMVRPDDRVDSHALVRFLAEAEAVGSVRHPHVVEVYELGSAEGDPFLAMEHLPGGTLADRLAADRPAPDEAARTLSKVARGVAAAHGLGIVHRDLKPANVLFDAAGEPKVADFGLARRGRLANLTAPGQMLGTPAYMAPEQASWSGEFVGPAADVWALGVILYESLTGRRPFDGGDIPILVAQIRSEDPDPPRTHAAAVPRDLERVCLKCLEKDARDRYPTAAELAADLDRFLAHEPVTVRSAGWVERTARWARRKPTAAVAWALGSAVTVLTGVAVTLAVAFSTASRERGNAEQSRRDAVGAQGETEAARQALARERERVARSEYGRTIQLAHQAALDDNVGGALLLLNGTRPDLRGWEWWYVHRLCNGQRVALKGHAAAVVSAAWDRDGRKVLTASEDNTARVWNAVTGKELVVLKGHSSPVRVAAWSRDGRKVVTGSDDGTARVWDAATGKELVVLRGHTGTVLLAVFSPDGARVFSTSEDGAARTWDATTGKELVVLTGLTGVAPTSFWWEGRMRSVPGLDNGTALAWDTGRRILFAAKGKVPFAAWNRDGRKVVTASDDGTHRVRDAATGRQLATLPGLTGQMVAMFSPDGKRIFMNAYKIAGVWDAETGKELATLPDIAGRLVSAAWDRDGRKIVTGSEDGTAQVWDAATGKELVALRGLTRRVMSAAFDPNATRVLTVQSASARVWDAATGQGIADLRGHTDKVRSAGWGRDGRVVTASDDGTARIWDPATAAVVRITYWEPNLGWIPEPNATSSPDGTRYVPGSPDAKGVPVMRLWRGRHEQLTVLRGHTGIIRSTAWSPDSRRVVTASHDQTARVWDADTGRELVAFRGHTGKVFLAVYSPDGTRVATTSDDRTARVWDAASGIELAAFELHEGAVTTAAWSPDGRTVVTGSDDRTARVWDAATGKEVAALRGHAGTLHSAKFSPDGKRVVTASDDGTVRLWDPTTGADLLALRGSLQDPLYRPKEDRTNVRSATFTADGAQVLMGGWTNYKGQVFDATPTDPQYLPAFPYKPAAPMPRPVNE